MLPCAIECTYKSRRRRRWLSLSHILLAGVRVCVCVWRFSLAVLSHVPVYLPYWLVSLLLPSFSFSERYRALFCVISVATWVAIGYHERPRFLGLCFVSGQRIRPKHNREAREEEEEDPATTAHTLLQSPLPAYRLRVTLDTFVGLIWFMWSSQTGKKYLRLRCLGTQVTNRFAIRQIIIIKKTTNVMAGQQL